MECFELLFPLSFGTLNIYATIFEASTFLQPNCFCPDIRHRLTTIFCELLRVFGEPKRSFRKARRGFRD